jgi:PRTRC genetic system protein E
MFKDLHQLALQTPLSMMVTAEGELLTLTILPGKQANTTATDGIDRTALTQPLQLTGTPDELMAEFSILLGRFGAERLSLSQQLDAAAAVIKAAREAAQTKASNAVRPKGKPTFTRTPAKPPTQQVELGEGDGEDETEDGTADGTDAPASTATETKPAVTSATDNFSLF